VAFKLLPEFAGLGIINMDEGVIATGDDLVLVELKTSNDMTGMGGKGDVARLNLTARPTLTDHMVSTIE